MKAPEKIYIQEGAIVRTEKTFDNDIKYIRKDALLEWAKEQQRKWEECINTSKKYPELKKSLATYSGAKIQTEELIEKLDSM